LACCTDLPVSGKVTVPSQPWMGQEADMKLSYHPKYNVAYLRLHEKTAQVTTIKVSDEMNIDIAPDGTVYGIELLNAKEQLSDNPGTLIVESEGHRREIPLTA